MRPKTNFVTVRQLRFCRCRVPSLTTEWVCHLPCSCSLYSLGADGTENTASSNSIVTCISVASILVYSAVTMYCNHFTMWRDITEHNAIKRPTQEAFSCRNIPDLHLGAAGTPAIMFFVVLQSTSRKMPGQCLNRFLPKLYQFIINLLSFHSMLYSLVAGSVVK
jgi:hypothetical protein